MLSYVIHLKLNFKWIFHDFQDFCIFPAFSPHFPHGISEEDLRLDGGPGTHFWRDFVPEFGSRGT